MTKDKNFIVNIAHEYTKRYSNDDYYNFLSKSKTNFLSNLNKLNYNQIKEVLRRKPEYSNVFYDGWHSIHYACLSNNSHVVSLMIDTAINQGMNEFPTTEKLKRRIPANISLLNFCASLDLDDSFATSILNLSSPENQNFELTLRYAFLYGSPKVVNFISKLELDSFQKTLLSSFCFKSVEDNKVKNNFYAVFVENFKCNPERFKDYNIDITYTIENERNYFTNTLYWLNNYSYLIDEMKEDKFKNIITFFLKNGCNLDDKDGFGDSPRKLLDDLKNKIFDSSIISMLENCKIEFEQLSLNNKLKQSKTNQPTKLKI